MLKINFQIHRLILPVIALGLLTLSFPCRSALAQNPDAACRRYAQEAVRQNEQNIKLQAGFKPPAWSSDFNVHYTWCKAGKNLAATPGHLAARAKQLQDFAIKKLGKDGAAQRYGKEAVRQYNESAGMSTGFRPPVWSSDYNGHYNWSKHGGNMATTPGHLASREKALQEFAIKHNKGPVKSATGGQPKKMVPVGKPVVVATLPKGETMPKAESANLPETGGKTIQALQVKMDKKMLARIDRPSQTESPNFAFDSDAEIFMYYPSDHLQKVGLGKGYDTLYGKVMSSAVDILPGGQNENPLDKTNELYGFVTEIKDGYVRSLDEFWEHLGVDIKVSGNYMGFSGSSETQFDKYKSNSNYAETYVASVFMETFVEYTNLSQLRLKPEALSVLKTHGKNEFYRRYGDCFLYAIYYGAALQGAASYNLLKESSATKIVTKNKTGGNWGFAGYSVGVDVETETKKAKERQSEDALIRSFGAGYPYLQTGKSVDRLKDLVSKFPRLAAEEARKSIASRKNGGVVRYEVMKYSSLPEFVQIAGDRALDLSEQRKLLFDLTHYRKKIEYMMNNIVYITDHPEEFKPHEIQQANAKKKELSKWVQTVNHDIFTLKKYPLDRSKWKFNNNYNHIPEYAPDTRFAKVKLHFPAEPVEPQTGGEHNWIKDHQGPLIGFNHTDGDGDAYANRIAIDINTELVVSQDRKEAFLKFKLKSVETQGDHTTYEGVKPLYKVYHAPENHIIVGFKKASEKYVFRDLFKNKPYVEDGAVIHNVHLQKEEYPEFNFVNAPISKPRLWPNLSVIFDTEDNDSQQGAFGDLVFEVELKPVK